MTTAITPLPVANGKPASVNGIPFELIAPCIRDLAGANNRYRLKPAAIARRMGIPKNDVIAVLARPPAKVADNEPRMSAAEFRQMLAMLGLSLTKAARLLGTCKQTAERYAKGKAIPPSVARLLRHLLTAAQKPDNAVLQRVKPKSKTVTRLLERGDLAAALHARLGNADATEIAKFLIAEALTILCASRS